MSYTILSSTLFTLFASFWCCIRPDFPSPYDSKLRILSAKLNIMFWVLIFPEGVLFWAMRQWFEAGNIPKEIVQFVGRGWTRRHGLFFLMGGFILCNKDGLPIKTLSLRQFISLLQQKVIDFPIFTSFEIQEQSNLHPLFALLAFLQGTWFLARCLSRISSSISINQGFPVITQLEAIIAILVVANWCIFFFAWKKPLDPRCLILIKPKVKRSVLHDRGQLGYRDMSDFEREQSQSHMTQQRFQFEHPHQPALRSVLQVTLRLLVSVAVWPFQSIFNDLTQFFPPPYYTSGPAEFPNGTFKIPLFYVEHTMHFSHRLLLPAAMLSMGTSIVSFLFILRSDSASFYFPSPTVYFIWRVASITTTSISASTLFLVVLIQSFDYTGSLFDPDHSVWNGRLDNIAFGCFLIFWLTLVVGLAPFLLARIILLVASFICLKSIPGDAFVGKWSWIDYIPHFQ